MTKPPGFLESLVKPFVRRSSKDAHEADLETIAAKEQKHFPYDALAAATRNFNPKNKLGEGGFGPVYKGRLDDGREVAVKKLSRGSKQGVKEFMNEAMLLSRVQHRNVVNLHGYCTASSSSSSATGDGHQEKLLVYEYVSHESLDKLLFHAEKRRELDWKRRHDIILGVARGLLYLHEDAHTIIIHRDIKASNILLDDKWAPKIADFGMARLFPEDQTHVNTRVAGTNGYMAPEYVMHGQLSTKADVFSFGVLVLELISGQKNSTFIPQPDAQSLLEWGAEIIPAFLSMTTASSLLWAQAWRLHRKKQSLDLMDEALRPTAVPAQVEMCIHIGLLCTQADPKQRPDMRRVVVILSKRPSTLEEPSKPGFPGSRYRRSHGPRSTSAASGEYSSASTSASASGSTSASASNPRTATTSTSNPHTATTSTSASASNPHTATTSTTTRSARRRSQEKRPMQLG